MGGAPGGIPLPPFHDQLVIFLDMIYSKNKIKLILLNEAEYV